MAEPRVYQRVGNAAVTPSDYDVSVGKMALVFDGIDDWLVTPTITPGTDKVQVFAGVRKLSDATGGRVFTNETSIGGADVGQTVLFAPSTNVANYGFRSGVTTMNTVTTSTSYAAPHTAVLSMHADVAVDSVVGRVNGTSFSGTSEMGTGDLPARALSIGRGQVSGAFQPFNGHLYGLIVRFGANLPSGTIASTESWVNGKTGALDWREVTDAASFRWNSATASPDAE